MRFEIALQRVQENVVFFQLGEGGGVAVRLDLRCRVEIAAVVKR